MEDLPGHLEQQHDQVDRRGGRMGPAHGIHCAFEALALLRNRRAAASSGRS